MAETDLTIGVFELIWRKYFLGRGGAAPIVVRFLRATTEIALLGAIGAVVVFLNTLTWAEFAPFQFIVFGALQMVEGWIDQKVDPTQNRIPVK